MANERKSGAADGRVSAVVPQVKQYRILHTIVLGKGEAREGRSSGFVTAQEVGGEAVIERLLKAGAIGDTDAPVRPSEASELRARAVVVDIARRAGVIEGEGDRYSFAGKTYSGEAELSEIPLVQIADAIVAAVAA
jgi:hypothetical protein